MLSFEQTKTNELSLNYPTIEFKYDWCSWFVDLEKI